MRTTYKSDFNFAQISFVQWPLYFHYLLRIMIKDKPSYIMCTKIQLVKWYQTQLGPLNAIQNSFFSNHTFGYHRRRKFNLKNAVTLKNVDFSKVERLLIQGLFEHLQMNKLSPVSRARLIMSPATRFHKYHKFRERQEKRIQSRLLLVELYVSFLTLSMTFCSIKIARACGSVIIDLTTIL